MPPPLHLTRALSPPTVRRAWRAGSRAHVSHVLARGSVFFARHHFRGGHRASGVLANWSNKNNDPTSPDRPDTRTFYIPK